MPTDCRMARAEVVHFDHGQFCRVDLNARDPDGARGFYSGVFGWTGEFAGRAAQAGGYERFSLDGRVVAGMGRMSDAMREAGAPSVWVSYVSVENVDAVAENAEALGATVRMPATDIADTGRMAMIDDPTGGTVAFWQPGKEAGAELVTRPGALCWNELATPDLDQACAFYGDLLGWSYRDNPHSPAPYRIIDNRGRPNGGVLQMTEEWGGMAAHWIVYFAVDDAGGLADRVLALDGLVHHGPFDTAAGRLVVCRDPQGAAFHALQMKGEEGDRSAAS